VWACQPSAALSAATSAPAFLDSSDTSRSFFVPALGRMIARAGRVAAALAFPLARLGRADLSPPSGAGAPEGRFDATSGMARRFPAAAADAPRVVFVFTFPVMFASLARVPGEHPGPYRAKPGVPGGDGDTLAVSPQRQ
jgi:hypothetical protein